MNENFGNDDKFLAISAVLVDWTNLQESEGVEAFFTHRKSHLQWHTLRREKWKVRASISCGVSCLLGVGILQDTVCRSLRMPRKFLATDSLLIQEL